MYSVNYLTIAFYTHGRMTVRCMDVFFLTYFLMVTFIYNCLRILIVFHIYIYIYLHILF